MKLSIVVCSQNQKESILSTLLTLRTVEYSGWVIELVVVDRNSTDGTRELLRAQDADNLQVIYQPQPLKTSSWDIWHQAAANHLTGDYTLLDRSLTSYDTLHPSPEHISKMLDKVEKNSVALYASNSTHDLTSSLVNLLTGSKLRNILSATKLVRSDLLKSLSLHGRGPSFEAELTVKLRRAGVAIQHINALQSDWPNPTSVAEQLRAMRAIFVARFRSSIWKPGHTIPSFAELESTPLS